MGWSEKTPWNHNIHYRRRLLAAVPPGAEHALDVGCGDGHLTRCLAGRVAHVTGIDRDPSSIDLARRTTAQPNVDYVIGDVRTHAFSPESFDVIVSIATLHHLDAATALQRLVHWLRPGGVLGIIGIARTRFPRDLGWQLAGSVGTHVLKRTGGRTYVEHTAPTVWPPPHTFDEVRRISERVLPGRAYRRHVLWRYSLIWTKPTALSI